MRLSAEQVKQGILHDDREVRFAALHYFAQSFSRDATVMPVAIEAFRRFGREEAFPFTFPIADLAQTPETIRWAIAELRQFDDASRADSNFPKHLARLLCNAEAELTRPCEVEIIESLEFDLDYYETFMRRLDAHAMDDDACWDEIEEICEADQDQEYVNETRYHEAKEFAAVLARRSPRHAERVMALLAEKFEHLESTPMVWLELLAVYMAGEMRYEPATPLLIGKLLKDEEILNDECLYALAKIGTDSVVRGLGEAFPSAVWGFRLFAAGVLGRIHSDQAVATTSELLLAEEDDEIRAHLAVALAEQFSTEGNELARQVMLDSGVIVPELRDALLPSCALLEQDFPEMAAWRQDAEQARQHEKDWERQLSRLGFDKAPRYEYDEDDFDEDDFDEDDFDEDGAFDDFIEDVVAPPFRLVGEPIEPEPEPAPVLQSHKGVGRNDPCPCGSGKKYKQCCLRKQTTLE